MKIEIKDNFLNKTDFDYLKMIFTSDEFPYFYNDFKVDENDGANQFTHTFVREGVVNSNHFNLLQPILDKLNVKTIERIKLNMTMKENIIEQHNFHCDIYDKECNTAIFYFNTNNGKTIFESGKEVSSVQNKMIIFPSNIKHTGTTHTDTKYRLVLNLNYN